MSTPENPESGQLTRRQIRQLRTTGSTPIVGSTAVATQEAPPPPPTPRAPLPRTARPVAVAPAPGPDASVDLGVSPLTRRQARQQERIRTASVPVITPEIAAAHGASATPSAIVPEPEAVLWTAEVAIQREADAAVSEDAPITAEVVEVPDADGAVAEETPADAAVLVARQAPPRAEVQVDEVPAADDAPLTAEVATEPASDDAGVESEEWSAPSDDVARTDAEAAVVESSTVDETAADDAWLDPSEAGAEPETATPQVDPRFGDHLLAVEQPADVDAVSFDDLLTHETGSGGTGSTPHALILSHVPEASALSAVTSTGEVIITGIYNLPDGLGSQGHAHGAADGKEIDATLMDGELPTSSSPTPIAASAAISTVRGTGEIIRPPAPDKSNRWVMVLAITAGALALALVITLAVAVGTGVFN